MDVTLLRFGVVVIDGRRYDHDVVVEAGRVRARDKGPSRAYTDHFGHTPLSAAEDIPWSPPRLVIGTGAAGRLPVMPEVVAEAESRGIDVVALPTAEAGAWLAGVDAVEVFAVLHVTC